jgi:cytochrome P450
LKGDPEGWTSTYNMVVSSLFNPWLNIFAKIDFLVQYISPERRRIMRATTKFNGMLDDLTNKKREEIRKNANANIPESEKDLLTLMIEADMRDNGATSNEELRVSYLLSWSTWSYTLISNIFIN